MWSFLIPHSSSTHRIPAQLFYQLAVTSLSSTLGLQAEPCPTGATIRLDPKDIWLVSVEVVSFFSNDFRWCILLISEYWVSGFCQRQGPAGCLDSPRVGDQRHWSLQLPSLCLSSRHGSSRGIRSMHSGFKSSKSLKCCYCLSTIDRVWTVEVLQWFGESIPNSNFQEQKFQVRVCLLGYHFSFFDWVIHIRFQICQAKTFEQYSQGPRCTRVEVPLIVSDIGSLQPKRSALWQKLICRKFTSDL